jgi:uncharacterized protein (DUF2235 family)
MGVWDTVGDLGIPVTPLRFWTKRGFEFHDVALSSHVERAYQALAIDEPRRPYRPALWQRQPDAPARNILEQQWFPGVHKDVGGGYEVSDLSDGALAWIWEKAEEAGLVLDPRLKPTPNPGGLQHTLALKWRLLGWTRRVLGQGGAPGAETVAQATLARLDRCKDYRPRNLMTFLADGDKGVRRGAPPAR